MICNTVLEAIGHTPLIRLNRMVDADSAEVLVKFEALNVGGSIKTRTALNMIEAAERKGLLKPDSIIVEPTSGNQGIGLALIGTDEQALQTSRDLARKEGLMVGISAGTNVFAALKLAKRLGPGKTVVTILPDTAERYFSTPLFNEDERV